MEVSKFGAFNDDELYMVKRAFMESARKIANEGRYTDEEIDLHTDLLNEAIDEIKRRMNHDN